MSDPARILIADDDETFLKSTADLLRREGYECDTASDGEAALAMIDEHSYSLLIADIIMPGNPKLELVEHLHRKNARIPVILVTAYPSLDSAVRSIHLPVAAYLRKPYEFSDLLAEVQRVLERHRLYDTVEESWERLRSWSDELEVVLKRMRDGDGDRALVSIDTFVALMFQNIIGALTGLASMTQSLARNDLVPGPEVCRLFRCPRLEMLKSGIHETIAVLHETKKSFKSMRLADQRQKLEELLEELEKADAPPEENA